MIGSVKERLAPYVPEPRRGGPGTKRDVYESEVCRRYCSEPFGIGTKPWTLLVVTR